jgi:hypothetical protein
LNKLICANNEITSDGFEFFLKALEECTKINEVEEECPLTEIDFSRNNISDEGATKLLFFVQ